MGQSIIWLVVLIILKHMKVSWDNYSQYIRENKNHVPKHQPEKGYELWTIYNIL